MACTKRQSWLNKPTRCDNCQASNIVLTDNKIIYGRNMGAWPRIWYCFECEAAVTCHPNSNYPMGKMATADTRRARQRVHKRFDKLHRKYGKTRTEAYQWLARYMQIPFNECHISYFDYEQCERALELIKYKIKKMKSKPATVTHSRGRKVTKRGQRRKNACQFN